MFHAPVLCALALAGPPNAERLARYADDSTFACVHVDLESIDVRRTIEAIAAHAGDASRQAAAREALASVADLAQALKAAGATEVIVLGAVRADSEPVSIVVPASPATKAAIRGAMGAQAVAGEREVTINLGSVVDAPDPERVHVIDSAIRAAGRGQAVVLVVPAEFARRAIGEMVPTLPDALGGGPSKSLTDGLVWAGISISLPPDAGLHAEAQSVDPEAAIAFAGMLSRARDWAVEVLSPVPGPLGDPADLRALFQALDPRPKADHVELSIGPDEADACVRTGVLALLAAREQAKGVVAGSTIRAALMGCMIYAVDNREEWPGLLAALVDKGMVGPEVLRESRHARPVIDAGVPAIVYRRPTPAQLRVSPSLAVMHEGYVAWPSSGIWVGYTDGHVDLARTEAEFRSIWNRWQ